MRWVRILAIATIVCRYRRHTSRHPINESFAGSWLVLPRVEKLSQASSSFLKLLWVSNVRRWLNLDESPHKLVQPLMRYRHQWVSEFLPHFECFDAHFLLVGSQIYVFNVWCRLRKWNKRFVASSKRWETEVFYYKKGIAKLSLEAAGRILAFTCTVTNPAASTL